MAEPMLSKADVLAKLSSVTTELDQNELEPFADDLRAIAAAVAAWCVVDGGHQWTHFCDEPNTCLNCGERRDTEPAGGGG